MHNGVIRQIILTRECSLGGSKGRDNGEGSQRVHSHAEADMIRFVKFVI